MNIIEAVKSNKPFRRRGWVDFIQFNENWGQFEWVSSGNSILGDLRPEWFTYEDWEVKEKKVSVTDTDFEAAVNRTTKSFSIYNPPHICEYLSQLKKELGL